jgi:DNA-binding MarR family transcriptional regulator
MVAPNPVPSDYTAEPVMHSDHPLPDNPALLTAMVARRTQTYFDRELKPHGIGFAQFRMLGFLYRHGDSPAIQEDIRAYIDSDKGSVAHSIRRLVDEGYITRTPHPEDGRAYEIHLTEKGEAFRSQWERMTDFWSRRLVEGLSDREHAALSGALRRMLDNACAELDENCVGNRS